MFQTYAFQPYAFQTVVGGSQVISGGGRIKEGYTYVHPIVEYRQREYERKIKQEKSDLEKLESVLAENKRKAELAAQNKLIASKKAALRLAKLEAEYLEEINRLMQVRAVLMLSIRRNEEALFMLMMMARRRLRMA